MQEQQETTAPPAKRLDSLRTRFAAVAGEVRRARREKRLLKMAFGFAAFTARELCKPKELVLFVGSILAPVPGPNAVWFLYHFNKYAKRMGTANDNAPAADAPVKDEAAAEPSKDPQAPCSLPRPRG